MKLGLHLSNDFVNNFHYNLVTNYFLFTSYIEKKTNRATLPLYIKFYNSVKNQYFCIKAGKHVWNNFFNIFYYLVRRYQIICKSQVILKKNEEIT